jgi:hypothetical protein
MDDNDRDDIMRTARANVERLAGLDEPNPFAGPEPERWAMRQRHELAEAEAERQIEREPAIDTLPWSAIDQRVREHLAAERRVLVEAIGEEIGHMLSEESAAHRHDLEMLAELKLEVVRLSCEVSTLREQLAAERGKSFDVPMRTMRSVN